MEFLCGGLYWAIRGTLLGGLLSVWNPKKSNFDAFLTPAGILLDGFAKVLKKNMKLVNYDKPYGNRQLFQDNLKLYGILKEADLILGGDLNLIVSTREIWGHSSSRDPMGSFLNQLFHDEGLIYLEPINLLLTWRNGRGDEDYIAKSFDSYLISENLVDAGLRYRLWVVNVKIYDHMPMILQLDKE